MVIHLHAAELFTSDDIVRCTALLRFNFFVEREVRRSGFLKALSSQPGLTSTECCRATVIPIVTPGDAREA